MIGLMVVLMIVKTSKKPWAPTLREMIKAFNEKCDAF